MNRRQAEVQRVALSDEEKLLKELRQVYSKALKDVNDQIAVLNGRTDLENLTTIVYQRQYQEAIKKQLEGALDALNSKQFTKISDYLTKSYETGWYGTLYDLHGQGIPLIFPIDQQQVKNALLIDSKLSQRLYTKLGVDIQTLKDSVRANLSRGISSGMAWDMIAKNIEQRMKVGYGNAIRIARTEGHRVLSESSYNAQIKAKSKGADIVKQWDSTLDGRTRSTHRQLDGQVRDVDKPFTIDGNEAMYPGAFGIPGEDINCRCALLQRAKWAMDESELETLKERAKYYGLDKTQDFEEFKSKFKIAEQSEAAVSNGNWSNIGFPINYKTKAEAVKALSDKYGIQFSDSRKYPIDEGILCDAVSWMDAFEKEFPEFVKLNPSKLPKLIVKAPSGMPGDSIGCFRYYAHNNEAVDLLLNGQYHTNPSQYQKYLDGAIKSKWTVPNSTTRKTFVHEYGHYVSNSMCAMNSASWEHDFIRDCVTEFKSFHPEYKGLTYARLFMDYDEVSRYGMSSESECFAECFAEFFGGENPREFSQIFGKKLTALLKGVK